mgnify:CR=1 FL=1
MGRFFFVSDADRQTQLVTDSLWKNAPNQKFKTLGMHLEKDQKKTCQKSGSLCHNRGLTPLLLTLFLSVR